MVAAEVAHVYRQTLRAAGEFGHSNFRAYFLRRARADYRVFTKAYDAGELDAAAQKRFLRESSDHLAMLKRQSVMSRLYDTEFPLTTR
eukprot:NODE_24404_length_626_cov_2.973948.p2 GENE.NODE_24404_length_626_cov_2.973948~~NODE_24404_length_626_cov_2.973948.p2  ORF type:complete len:88 (-),score=27.88 NODE_24404_length_626_cov_2.973948:183-446(-)